MATKKYFPLENRMSGAKRPAEDPEIGPWYCVSEEEMREEGFDYGEFLEVHQSDRGDGVVFRVSDFNAGRIDLGQCVILNRKNVTAVRDRLNALLEALETGNE